jgi:hypothetical protein
LQARYQTVARALVADNLCGRAIWLPTGRQQPSGRQHNRHACNTRGRSDNGDADDRKLADAGIGADTGNANAVGDRGTAFARIYGPTRHADVSAGSWFAAADATAAVTVTHSNTDTTAHGDAHSHHSPRPVDAAVAFARAFADTTLPAPDARVGL